MKKPKRLKTLCIHLALGDLYDDRGQGELIYPPDGGIARLDMLRSRAGSIQDSLLVSSAGYAKRSSLRPVIERQVSLAGQLERYIYKQGDLWRDRTIARPLCWSTRNEVRVGMKLAIISGFASKDEEIRVLIASNSAHLRRIRLYTKMYAPKKWQVELVPAKHFFSFRSHVMEPGKLLRDLFYAAKLAWRLRRYRRYVARQNAPQRS